MGPHGSPAVAVSQAIFSGSRDGFQVNLVQRKPPDHSSQCQPDRCTSLMSASNSKERARAGRSLEQPKNYSVEHDPGMTVRIIAQELLISACQKQQKSLMVVDGGTLPLALSVTLQCPHFQAPKMSTCSVNTCNLHPPSSCLWGGHSKIRR